MGKGKVISVAGMRIPQRHVKGEKVPTKGEDEGSPARGQKGTGQDRKPTMPAIYVTIDTQHPTTKSTVSTSSFQEASCAAIFTGNNSSQGQFFKSGHVCCFWLSPFALRGFPPHYSK